MRWRDPADGHFHVARPHSYKHVSSYAKLFLVRRTMKHDVVTSECFSLWIHFPTKITDWKKFIEWLLFPSPYADSRPL